MIAERIRRRGHRASPIVATIAMLSPCLGASSLAATDVGQGRQATAAHIYWTNPETSRGAGGPGINTVASANIDGSGVNRSLIATSDIPGAIAVDARHLYWANTEAGTVGRANLNGRHANEHFITGLDEPFGIAVDGGHLYWTNFGAGTIGRASIDGSQVQQSFILAGEKVENGDGAPMGLAVGP